MEFIYLYKPLVSIYKISNINQLMQSSHNAKVNLPQAEITYD